jgi:hypothetical protein
VRLVAVAAGVAPGDDDDMVTACCRFVAGE